MPDQYTNNLMFAVSELEEEKQYWVKKLQGEIVFSAFPTDQGISFDGSQEMGMISQSLPKEVSNKLFSMSRNSEYALYMILLTGVKSILYRYTTRSDVVVGMPAFKQNQQEARIANLLVLRTQVDESMTFKELLMSVKQTVTEADTHSNFPYAKIAELFHLQDPKDQKPVIRTMVLLEQIHPQWAEEVCTHVLFSFSKGEDNIRLKLQYDAHLYEKETMQKVTEYLLNFLHVIVEDPNITLRNMMLLSESDQEQVLYTFNDTLADYPKDKTVHQIFEEQVKKTPDHIAVVFEDQQWTYRELNNRVNGLAMVLREQGIGRDSIIAILMERSFEMSVSLLAVMKAGGAYLPISPDYPDNRIQYMLEDSGALLLLTQAKFEEKLSNMKINVPILDVENESLYQKDCKNLERINHPKDLAYVIYTSGSTGKPKGAMLEHRSLVNRLHWMQRAYPIGEGDTILQKTPYTFDVSVWELFWWSLCGARVCFLKPGGEKDPQVIMDAIEKSNVTTLHFVPSMLHAFLGYIENSTDIGKLKSLKRVFASGEALHTRQTEMFNNLLNKKFKTTLHNLYGPTEAAIDVSYFDCSDGRAHQSIPIGKPIDNIQLYVLDQWNRPQMVGVAGELHIAGVGLARGYLNKPELTAEKFVINPFAKEPTKDSDYARMYRTGDLARWLPDGNLEYLGRIDNQVKVRGFRIELGEIEAALLKLADVKEAATAVKTDREGNRYICAYVVSKHSIQESVIKKQLEKTLPNYMIPTHFVQMVKIPLSANGKIDRNALPEPEAKSIANQVYLAPENEMERKLAGLWQEHLKMERVSVNAGYFNVGGDSIKAISLVSRINRELNTELLIQDLYLHQTIRELANRLLSTDRQAHENFLSRGLHMIEELKQEVLSQEQQALKLPSDYEDFYPLSSIQQGMVFFTKLLPNEPIYHDQFPYVVKMPLFDIHLFNKALSLLVEKHAILRTTFSIEQLGRPMQMVHHIESGIVPKVQMDDLTGLHEDEQQSRIYAYTQQDLKKRFKFDNDLLWRLRVFLLDHENYCLILSFQHAVLDGWSVASMMNELFTFFDQLYRGEAIKLVPLKSSYKDYIALNMSKKTSEKVNNFWKTYLKDYSRNKLPLNISGRKIGGTSGSRILRRALDTDLLLALEKKAATYQCTFKELCLAAHVYLLSILTTDQEIITGVVSHDRPALEDAEKVLGCFLNTIPIRIKVEAQEKKTALLEKVKNGLRDIKIHELFLAEIASSIGENGGSGNPIFDTLMNYTDFHVMKGIEQEGKVTLREDTVQIPPNEMTNTLFDVEISKTLDVMVCQIKYSPKYFDEGEVATAFELYTAILKDYAYNEEEALDVERLLSQSQIQAMVYDFNNTQTIYAKEKTMHQLFEEQVEKAPEQLALVLDDQTMTYNILNKKANQLARGLIAQGVQSKDTIALVADRSFEMIIGMLAILKSGGAYVPIDPQYPLERKQYIADNAKVRAVLTDAQTDIVHKNIIVMDDAILEPYKEDNLSLQKDATDIAYIIYTSGSTGVPKGVVIEHHSAVNLISWVNKKFSVGSDDALLFITSMCFDLSVYDIFGILAAGGRVVIARKEQIQTPQALITLLKKNRITFWDSVPSTMNYFIGQLEENRSQEIFEDIRLVLMSGDWIPVLLPEQLRKYLPNACVISLGGATEGTVWSNYYPIDAVDRHWISIPYGKPIDNNYFYILDQQARLVPPGVAGELYIGGVGVARGYVGRPELNEKSFVPNRFLWDSSNYRAPKEGAGMERMYKTGDLGRLLPDGNLEFLGRMDSQVKIRGYRVELGEIENKLLTHASVKEAVVVDRSNRDGEKYLCAYIVWQQEETLATMRAYLAKVLPDYMMPTYFVSIDQIPLTANGKIAKKDLPEPEGNMIVSVEYVAPRNEIETALVEVWENVLDVKEISIYSNFFELGGDSLKAIRVVSSMAQKGWNLSIVDMMTHTTIDELGGIVTKNEHLISQEIVEGEVPLLPVQSYQFERKLMHHEHNAISLMIYREDGFDEQIVTKVLQKITEHHDALRMVYKNIDGNIVQYNRGIEGELFNLKIIHYEEGEDYENLIPLEVDERQRSMNLEKGPLVQVGLYKTVAGDHLFFAVHHIAFDGESLKIFMQSFMTAYMGMQRGQKVELPQKTTSLMVWSKLLQEYAFSEEVLGQLPYWRSIDDMDIDRIPKDYPIDIRRYQDIKIVSNFKNKEETEKIIKGIKTKYALNLQEALLVAFGLALKAWKGMDKACMRMIGNGRNMQLGHADITNTIGSFSISYPFTLDMSASADIHQMIQGVQNSLASIPGNGIGYDILRYITLPKGGYGDSFKAEFEMIFNYMGFAGIEEADKMNFATLSDIKTGEGKNEEDHHEYALVITAAVFSGNLGIIIDYNIKEFEKATIHRLTELCHYYLRVLALEQIGEAPKYEDQALGCPS